MIFNISWITHAIYIAARANRLIIHKTRLLWQRRKNFLDFWIVYALRAPRFIRYASFTFTHIYQLLILYNNYIIFFMKNQHMGGKIVKPFFISDFRSLRPASFGADKKKKRMEKSILFVCILITAQQEPLLQVL